MEDSNITLEMISDDELDLGEYSNEGNMEINDITDVIDSDHVPGEWADDVDAIVQTSIEYFDADVAYIHDDVPVDVPIPLDDTGAIHDDIPVDVPVDIPVPFDDTGAIPKMIFIVPYRNRDSHLAFFKEHMKKMLEDDDATTYKIYYIHQCDARIFNRGAMKNIGFLFVKNKYPQHYKNITLVFNDVDSMPIRKNMIHYETTSGVIKHFFGFEYTLGGIVSIKASEFEILNGFPNFWAWGYEDNLLQQRALKAKLTIDRSTFFPIGDKNIIHLSDGPLREVNQGEFNRYAKNTYEGIFSITKLEYTFDKETGFVNVKWFETGQIPDINKYRFHHLKDGPAPYDTRFGLMYNNRRIQNGSKMTMNI